MASPKMPSMLTALESRWCILPRALLLAASGASVALCIYTLNEGSKAAAVIGIITGLVSTTYSLLVLVCLHCTRLCTQSDQVPSRWQVMFAQKRRADLVIFLVWCFAYFLYAGTDIYLATLPSSAQYSQTWRFARYGSMGLAMITAALVLVHNKQPLNCERSSHNEKSDIESAPPPRLPFMSSTSFLSAKPSLSSISSGSRSSKSDASSLCKPIYTTLYTPFPLTGRIFNTPVTNLPPHPKLQRVSSTPSLPQIPTFQPIDPLPELVAPIITAAPTPNRANLARRPSSMNQQSRAQQPSAHHRSQSSLQRAPSPLFEAAATFPGANMASVRRARSRNSRSSSCSASTRRSRLRIMETVKEPEEGEEDTCAGQQEEIPAVPPLNIARWGGGTSDKATRPQDVHIYTCRIDTQTANPSSSSQRSSGISIPAPPPFKDRPLPPLPLNVIKNLHITRAERRTPSPTRAQSRVSKAASVVRSKSTATARSVASARVRRERKIRQSVHAREEALGSEVELARKSENREGANAVVIGDRVARSDGLGLELVPDFRRSALAGLRVVGS